MVAMPYLCLCFLCLERVLGNNLARQPSAAYIFDLIYTSETALRFSQQNAIQ